MSLSRTDLVPVLAIVVGGAIGGLVSFGFLGSRSDNDVRVGTVTGQVTDAPCFGQRRISAPPGWVQEPGSSITIRGFSPIEPANQPVLVIDGVLYASEECHLDLEPDDIEDSEILMSAAAVRRFGKEASNGAIVITLKKDPRRRP